MMYLKKIAVRGFRKFVEPVVITGLTRGVNIIAGDNEDGKSTIVQAVKAAFYTKHSKTSVSSFQPYGSAVLPEVELEFDMGDTNYRLRKTFGKKGTAELRVGNAGFSGSEAEEKLEQLLWLGEDGNEKSRESSIWSVLWVEQGTAFQKPDVKEVGRRTLSNALENEVGKIIAGGDGQELFARIGELYEKWYTKSRGAHAATSEYLKCNKELLELTSQFEKLQTEYAEYKGTIDELGELRQTLSKHDTEKTVEKAARALADAQSDFAALQAKQSELDKFRAQATAEAAQYKTVSASFQARNEAIRVLKQTEADLANVLSKLAAARAEFDAASKALHDSQQTEQKAEEDCAAADERCNSLQAAIQLSNLKKSQEQLTAQLQKAQASQDASAEIRKQANALKCDRATVEKLRNLDKQLGQLEAQLQAVATKLEFRPQAGKTVNRSGHAVESEKPVLITEQAAFQLDGWGEIVVTPGGENIEKLRSDAQSAKEKFEKALGILGIKSLSEAEEQERTKSKLSQEADEKLRDVLKFAPAGIQALTDQLSVANGQYEQLSGSIPADSTTPENAEDLLQKAKAELAVLKQSVQKARALREQTFTKLNSTSALVQKLLGEQQTLEKNQKEQAEKIQQLRQEESDDALAQRMTEARIKNENAQQALNTLLAELKETNPSAAEAKIKQAQTNLEQVQRQIQLMRERQISLSGQLQTFGKTGIAEEFTKIKDKKEEQELQAERLLKRAQAIKLLYETIADAEKNSKSELAGPLARQLQPYVDEVFEGKLLFNSADFSITNLQREATTEQYGDLSLGTREQLSVLTRLAFAHVLAENDCPALVILDDALVYSDEHRFDRMQKALLHAAEKFQVIILTCRIRDWATMERSNIIHLENCTSSATFA